MSPKLWAPSGYRYGSNPNTRLEPLPDNRPLDLFDLACAAVCVAITVATVVFAWGVS